MHFLRIASYLAIGATTSLGASTGASAQDAAGPSSAAEIYLEALMAQDWSGVANMMHPQALTDVRNLTESVVEADSTGEFLSIVYGNQADEFNELSNEDVYAGLLKFASFQDPRVAEVMASAKQEIVGHVAEDSTAHVVLRLRIEGRRIPVTQMHVLSFRSHGGVWRALLQSEVRSMLLIMRSMLAR